MCSMLAVPKFYVLCFGGPFFSCCGHWGAVNGNEDPGISMKNEVSAEH